DNLEHLYFPIVDAGQYTLRVSRRAVDESGEDELYGLAWSVTAVPEPSTWVLMAMAAGLLVACRGWLRRVSCRHPPFRRPIPTGRLSSARLSGPLRAMAFP